ncbi:Uncharacterised protein [Raoultella ornithinolytica]|nr:Uncharacterised protein [Raoultella ornithinolytica]
MQVDFFCSALGGQLYHRHNVVFVAVNAARGHQAHNVHGFTRSNGFVDRGGQHRVCKERAFFDFDIKTGQILVNDTTGAEVNVTHFRVAHLAIRQTNLQARSINQRMGTFRPQCVHDWRFRAINRVILLVFTIAIAIKNDQYHRLFRIRHCDNLMLKDRKFA